MRVIVLAVIVIAASSRVVAAQDVVTGNLFAGVGVFKCCAGETGAWEIGAGADVPIRRGVSADVEFGSNGPLGEGLINAQPFAQTPSLCDRRRGRSISRS